MVLAISPPSSCGLATPQSAATGRAGAWPIGNAAVAFLTAPSARRRSGPISVADARSRWLRPSRRHLATQPPSASASVAATANAANAATAGRVARSLSMGHRGPTLREGAEATVAAAVTDGADGALTRQRSAWASSTADRTRRERLAGNAGLLDRSPSGPLRLTNVVGESSDPVDLSVAPVEVRTVQKERTKLSPNVFIFVCFAGTYAYRTRSFRIVT